MNTFFVDIFSMEMIKRNDKKNRLAGSEILAFAVC